MKPSPYSSQEAALEYRHNQRRALEDALETRAAADGPVTRFLAGAAIKYREHRVAVSETYLQDQVWLPPLMPSVGAIEGRGEAPQSPFLKSEV